VFAGNCQGRHARETGPRGCRLVTVNDSLGVKSAEWRDLDVVRWNELKVDLTGIDEEAGALTRTSEAMGNAVANADGRLVAARIVLTGTTSLHGSLHRDDQRWHAEILARAQDQGAEALWIERIRIATTPVYDVAQLVQRDALTRIVVENLDQAHANLEVLPPEIGEMLAVLPPEVRHEVEVEWSSEQRNAVLDDVRAVILEALGTKGGETS
jgi:DNA repair protein SbcD/Mre11